MVLFQLLIVQIEFCYSDFDYCNLTNTIMSILMKFCPIVTFTCVISLVSVTEKTNMSTATIVDGTWIEACM